MIKCSVPNCKNNLNPQFFMASGWFKIKAKSRETGPILAYLCPDHFPDTFSLGSELALAIAMGFALTNMEENE